MLQDADNAASVHFNCVAKDVKVDVFITHWTRRECGGEGRVAEGPGQGFVRDEWNVPFLRTWACRLEAKPCP